MRNACLLLLTILLAAPALAHGPSVDLAYGRVKPQSLAIRAGDTVHFHNHSTTPRVFTVRGTDGSFEGPSLQRGGDWHHTFEEPGRFEYHVVEFPDMKGTIIVAPADDAS